MNNQTWIPLSEAKTDGTHYLLAIKYGPFVYAIEGAYYNGKWMNAADRDGEILCCMIVPDIPNMFLPWTEEYKNKNKD